MELAKKAPHADVPGGRDAANHIKCVGVIGGGVMGAPIIYMLASKGFAVKFTEINQQAVEDALRRMHERSFSLPWGCAYLLV